MTFGRYLCVGPGTQGGICRGAACDGGLMCIGGFCRTQSFAAQPCDPANFRTACVTAGQSCRGIAQPASGICAPPEPEVEPNDNANVQAPAAVTFSTVFTGSLATGSDVDCFRFTVTEGTSIIAETHENNGICAPTTDTVLTVYTADGAMVASDDDSGNTWCSLLDGTRPISGAARNPVHRMRAGTYAICVSSTSLPMSMDPPAPIARYFLSLRFAPPA